MTLNASSSAVAKRPQREGNNNIQVYVATVKKFVNQDLTRI